MESDRSRREAEDASRRRQAIDEASYRFRKAARDSSETGEEVGVEDLLDVIAAIAAHGGEAGSAALRQFQAETGSAQDSRPLSAWGHDRIERRRRARDNGMGGQYERREESRYPDHDRGQLGASDRSRSKAYAGDSAYALPIEQQWDKVAEMKFRTMFGDQAANIGKMGVIR
jgi:hypothetical protein